MPEIIYFERNATTTNTPEGYNFKFLRETIRQSVEIRATDKIIEEEISFLQQHSLLILYCGILDKPNLNIS